MSAESETAQCRVRLFTPGHEHSDRRGTYGKVVEPDFVQPDSERNARNPVDYRNEKCSAEHPDIDAE